MRVSLESPRCSQTTSGLCQLIAQFRSFDAGCFPGVPGTSEAVLIPASRYSTARPQPAVPEDAPEPSHPLPLRENEGASPLRCSEGEHTLLCPRKRESKCWRTWGTLMVFKCALGHRVYLSTHLIPTVLLQTVEEAAGVGQPERRHLKVVVVLLWRERETPLLMSSGSGRRLPWCLCFHAFHSYPACPRQT